jgi:hypothetical protein
VKIRSIGVLAGSLLALSGCDGLKEALTAHVDVAARAADHELSVNRLSDLLGNATLQIPVNRETAMVLTDLWSSYQLLGVAAAHNDSLSDPKLVDEAAAGVTNNVRLRRFMESVSKSFRTDSGTETSYNQATGGIFVAKHILFKFPDNPTPQQRDSVRRRAESIRPQVTNANFGDMAKRYSADGSAQRGGNLGAFRREDMVKPFSDAVAALKPGQISPLVETQFGYHIVQRPTYAEAKADYDQVFGQGSMQVAESTYIAKLDAESNINVKSNAAQTAKGAARDIPAHRDDDDVMATYKGGDLTVAKFIRWVESYPPQARIAQQLASPQTPDTIVREFVKSVARNEVMLKKADSAGITISAEEKTRLYDEFRQLVTGLWQQLGIEPKSLADSAKSVPERERVAATRIEAYLDRIMSGQAQPLSVPQPVQAVMQKRYQSKVYPAGVDRAVERAKKLRSSADSARTANQPRSSVPLPAPRPDSGAPAGTGTKRP